MPPRPKHNDKDMEKLLKEAEKKSWEVDGGGKVHFKAFCPCGEHMKTISTTPSNPNYEKRTRRFLERHTCWAQDK